MLRRKTDFVVYMITLFLQSWDMCCIALEAVFYKPINENGEKLAEFSNFQIFLVFSDYNIHCNVLTPS